ncbi:unnamed protein product [Blepharisma stoltei]|uniref:Uncharacterized protein n=1 Tax=Blepharisma stoltei TaxID=1481888 RepID=A0AAU9JFX0_9CILI|nr:unnamed protein product [Blepharisma stoltei]
MEKLNSSIDVSNEVVFFVLNGYDEAFHYCNQSMHEIVACQKSQILDYKSEILVLLIVGIFAFALCICFMTPFCYSAIKNENILWNKIRKHAYKYYDKLYQPCIERLSSIHSKLETTVNNELRFKNDQNFRNSWKYIWRLCLLLIVTSAFCIVSITVFYGMLIKYLYSRPELIENLLNSQILLTDLDVWTTEASLKITSYSIEGQTEYPNPFSNTYKKFIDSVSRINVQQKKIRDPKYSPIISDSFKQRFYEEYAKSERLEHRMGSYAAEEYSITEAEFISRFDAQYINDWINLVVELQDLDSIYDGLIDSINKYSLSVINQQMKIIIAALVIFIICCCVMYACLYLTFFIKEKRNLKRISSMLEIMPQ